MTSNSKILSFEVFPPTTQIGSTNLVKTLDSLRTLSPDFISVTCSNNNYDNIGDTTIKFADYVNNTLDIPAVAHLPAAYLDKAQVIEILERLKDKHIKKILFVSKGMKFFAFKYDKEMGDAVASSIFYIIKVDSTVVLPDYVTCILNHSKSISYFNQVSAGSSIPSIRKKELLDFEIPIHSMEMQKKIVDMYKIHKKEIEILEQLKEKKQVLFNQIINNFSK